MLMWHKKGEQRMIETSKQQTHTGTSQDHRERNTDTHTETPQVEQKTTCTGYNTGGGRRGGLRCLKAFRL
jgi:hypothetical protein